MSGSLCELQRELLLLPPVARPSCSTSCPIALQLVNSSASIEHCVTFDLHKFNGVARQLNVLWRECISTVKTQTCANT